MLQEICGDKAGEARTDHGDMGPKFRMRHPALYLFSWSFASSAFGLFAPGEIGTGWGGEKPARALRYNLTQSSYMQSQRRPHLKHVPALAEAASTGRSLGANATAKESKPPFCIRTPSRMGTCLCRGHSNAVLVHRLTAYSLGSLTRLGRNSRLVRSLSSPPFTNHA